MNSNVFLLLNNFYYYYSKNKQIKIETITVNFILMKF